MASSLPGQERPPARLTIGPSCQMKLMTPAALGRGWLCGHDADDADEEVTQTRLRLRAIAYTSYFPICYLNFTVSIWRKRPGACFKCGANGGRRAWIGDIPRGSLVICCSTATTSDRTVPVSEGHISLAGRIRFWSRFPGCNLTSGWTKSPAGDAPGRDLKRPAVSNAYRSLPCRK